MINWVVFDLGNVVLKNTEALADLALLLAADPDETTAAYFAHRTEYDRHSDPVLYFSAMATQIGAAAPNAAMIAELVRVDDLGWSVTDPEVLALMADLAESGISLAVLSNAPSSMGRLIEAQEWATHFRHLVFSGDLGVMKPDAVIFRKLLARLEADPGEVAFVDDRADNVAGAIAVGISALRFTGATQARQDLRALGLAV
ncbi:MAG: HAD family phosphatase [Actinomycetota bacterium]|nr:HAD family phosphatase [Actinomycetota bacterium]